MRPVALSDEIAVGEIPSADEIAILARAGFRSLLNVQPEGEVERLLTAAEVAEGAAAAGMKYAHVPVASRRVPEEKVAAFAQAMVSLPRPIYACCYSGARAAAAWALAVSSAMAPADIVANCNTAGFDISALLPELERRHRGPVAPPAAAMTPPPTAATPPPPPAPADVLPTVDAPAVPAATTVAQVPSSPQPAPAAPPKSAAAAIDAAEKIIFPRAAGSGGFSTAG